MEGIPRGTALLAGIADKCSLLATVLTLLQKVGSLRTDLSHLMWHEHLHLIPPLVVAEAFIYV